MIIGVILLFIGILVCSCSKSPQDAVGMAMVCYNGEIASLQITSPYLHNATPMETFRAHHEKFVIIQGKWLSQTWAGIYSCKKYRKQGFTFSGIYLQDIKAQKSAIQ